jgi:energy-coupling factor transporter ATP-binding protein EcfA2
MIHNILGGFLFTGDDIYKKAGVLSGGERTRLAVARMLLRPANTLLLDEPTNHLDLDSKDVLLEALEDFGGTLIFVSHDRYFVDRLATKVIEVGHGSIEVYPGTYEEFHWSKAQRAAAPASPSKPAAQKTSPAPTGNRRPHDTRANSGRAAGSGQATRSGQPGQSGHEQSQTSRRAAERPGQSTKTQPSNQTGRAATAPQSKGQPRLIPGKLATPAATDGSNRSPQSPVPTPPKPTYEEKKRTDAENRKRQRAQQDRARRLAELEGRIAEREQDVKGLEADMARPAFYEDRARAETVIRKHQTLMWEVGDLMNQWESLQAESDED